MHSNNKEKGGTSAAKWGRVALFIILDIVFINLSVFLSLLIRFDVGFDGIAYDPVQFADYMHNFLVTAPINTAVSIGIFALFRLYSNILKYISFREICFEISSCVISSLMFYAFSSFIGLSLPRSCYIVSAMFLMGFLMVSRYMMRFLQTVKKLFSPKHENNTVRRVMIIGAGNTASMLIRELKSNEFIRQRRVVCAIDDNKSKIGQYIYGIKVVGDREYIVEAAAKYRINEIIYAIASTAESEKSEILNICKRTKCVLRILPGIDQILEGSEPIEGLRKVQFEDLLSKPRLAHANQKQEEYIKGKTVLVTGGAGSIGVGLCKQILHNKPKTLIVVDMHENNIFELNRSLNLKNSKTTFLTYVTTVRDESSIDEIFEKNKPDTVFHCAAYKHVPIMERNPEDAVKNNIFGTLNVMRAADRHEVKKFVYISTNKAYAPTNVMAATKHICEMFLQCFQKTSRTAYCAVRFGNILGTSGGVVQIFEDAIKKGGPLTVTDPNMTRNFMTLDEVSSLIVRAGGIASGGEIFALDTGTPLKIADLAENMIRLAGYTPYVDIDIRFTGLRDGETLDEKPPIPESAMQKTACENIYVCEQIDIEETELVASIDKLGKTLTESPEEIKSVLSEIIGVAV